GCGCAILIASQSPTGPAISDLRRINRDIWYFLDSELRTNITQHIYCPAYTPIYEDSPKERIDIPKNKYNKLPILISYVLENKPTITPDPIVKYYGWSKGTLIKIRRDNTIIDSM